MTVAELIRRLQALDPSKQVMVLDSPNGGGHPRELNLGPTPHTVTAANVDDTADCEEIGEGAEVYVLGYGCY